MAGHRDGEAHKDALAGCLDAVNQGLVLFPISDSIYFEVSKIRQYRQRRHLREVIEKVSGFMVVTARSVVSIHEIEAVLDRLVGPNPGPINSMDYLDWGIARAMGMVGGFRVRSEAGEDVTPETRLLHPDGPAAFDRLLALAELDLNRKVIDGPTPDEEDELGGLGWDPSGASEVAQRREAQEIEQVERFNLDARWRRGRIRDVVAVREVLIEVQDELWRGLASRGVELEAVFSGEEEFRRAFDSMPSLDVAITLKTALHRDPMHRWTQNDIHDIDALGSTLPYCDIVVTDKAMASHVMRASLAERLHTTVVSRVSDALQLL
jgi:hypothetical protein